MKIKIIGIAVLLIVGANLAQAQQMKRNVAASGGGHSESASVLLNSTVGQVCAGGATSSSNRLLSGFWTGGAAVSPPTCDYVQGDNNGDGQRLAADVTYGVRYFKGTGPVPPDSCYLDSAGAYLYVAGDVNGNCEFRGSDITRLVQYFKGSATLSNCHFFPPPVLKIQRINVAEMR